MDVVYDLETPVSSLPLPDRDLIPLIGNILENAIEASEEWQMEKGKQAQITFQLYKRSGLFILNCKNATLPLPNEVSTLYIRKRQKRLKSGHHEGLGTGIIADIVNKYNGHLDFIYKDETFTLHIKIPAINRND